MTLPEKRQVVIDRLFPVGSQLGWHKFQAETGECDQCHIKFTDWLILRPDGSYSGGTRMCNVIGPDEVAQFRWYEG